MSIFNNEKYLDIYFKGYDLYNMSNIKINKINDYLYQGRVDNIIVFLDLKNLNRSSCSLCKKNICPHIVSVYFKCVKSAKMEYLGFLNKYIEKHNIKDEDLDDDFILMMTMMDDDEEGDV